MAVREDTYQTAVFNKRPARETRMTWTDEEREEAADACQLIASNKVFSDEVIDRGHPAWDLARMARLAVVWDVGNDELTCRECWAEAEARLRFGWMPGDEP